MNEYCSETQHFLLLGKHVVKFCCSRLHAFSATLGHFLAYAVEDPNVRTSGTCEPNLYRNNVHLSETNCALGMQQMPEVQNTVIEDAQKQGAAFASGAELVESMLLNPRTRMVFHCEVQQAT